MTLSEAKQALIAEFREQRDRDVASIDAVDRYGIRLRVNNEDVTDAHQERRRALLAELDAIIADMEKDDETGTGKA